jgi:hypothetical protein
MPVARCFLLVRNCGESNALDYRSPIGHPVIGSQLLIAPKTKSLCFKA